MGALLDDEAVGRILPGSWRIAASNFPVWLAGDRLEPRFSFELVTGHPLVLAEDVQFSTPEGEEKHILGTATWMGDGFRWRGKGLKGVLPGYWSVAGVSDDESVAVIRVDKSFASEAGIDILVREGTQRPEVRALVARATEEFGLSPEDFGSLTWLVATPSL